MGHREPETLHGATNSDNSERWGELIHLALLLHRPHGSPQSWRRGNWSRGACILWVAAAGIRGLEASREPLLRPEPHLGGALGGQWP